MQTKSFSKGTGTFSAFQELAVAIQTGTRKEIRAKIIDLQTMPLFAGKRQAQSMLGKLAEVVKTAKPVYSIFAEHGNGKLPFVAFSSLPGVTCPGAGACINFCYSYRAWRFAHSFGRMAQNAFLMRFGQNEIRQSLGRLVAKLGNFDLRLYVDGDFSSASDVEFWMGTISSNPTVRAYGYSKSFAELLSYSGQWPANYKLNLSSGHNHSSATMRKLSELPIVRGQFIALSVGYNPAGKWNTKQLNSDVRESGKLAGIDRLFVCPWNVW
jgi:hypothetical protein